MRRNLLIALVAALGMLASNAHALTVTYNLAGSHLDVGGGSPIPNAAAITGSIDVTYTDDGFGGIAPGTATVGNMTLNIDLSTGGLAGIGISGSVAGTEAALPDPGNAFWAGGPLIGGGPGSSVTMNMNVSGTVDCDQSNVCGLVFGIPASTPVSFLGPNILEGANSTLTTFFATQPFSVDLGSGPTPATLVLVPEPGTLMLLGSGVAGLVAFGRKRTA